MQREHHQVGADPGHDVDQHEARRAQRSQHGAAERVEREHVEQEVPDASVREVRQQHAEAVLAPRDLVRDEEEPLGAAAAVGLQRPESGEAYEHVDGDEDQDGHRAARTTAR